jgi:hypothetical protein
MTFILRIMLNFIRYKSYFSWNKTNNRMIMNGIESDIQFVYLDLDGLIK